MKLSVVDQLTEIYFWIDNLLKDHPQWAQWRQSNNSRPQFTDAEVVTIALMQGYFGCATLQQTYLLVRANAPGAFPQARSYKQWVARLPALDSLVGRLLGASSLVTDGQLHFYKIDSKPIPVCQAQRHGRVRLLREDGAYWGKSSKGWFFGFKLHTLVDQHGQILGAVLTPGNMTDKDVALALGWAVDGGIVVGDLGYRGEELADLLAEEADLLLLTRAVAGEKKALLATVRAGIETTFSQLWNRFVDRVYWRSWQGLWNTLKLKMLHFNLCNAGLLPA
jgi:transposase